MARERQPEEVLGIVEAADVTAESFWRNPDHRIRRLVDRDRAADDLRIVVEEQLPHPVADDGLRLGARGIIYGRKAAPTQQRHANRRKVVARNEHRRDVSRGALIRRSNESLAAAPGSK